MRHSFTWLSIAVLATVAQAAMAQNVGPVRGTAGAAADAARAPGVEQRIERREDRRELRRTGELPAARANAAANGTDITGKPGVAPGANVAVPSAGVGVNAVPGGGVGIAAPGVGVTVPRAGSGAGVGVAVPGAGVNIVANPNQWRYRWHNNRWWYYHPNNRWSYWNNSRWNAYNNPSSTAARTATPRTYSNAPQYQSGYRGLNNGPAAAANSSTTTPRQPAAGANLDSRSGGTAPAKAGESAPLEFGDSGTTNP